MTPLRLGVLGGGVTSAVGRAHFTGSRMDGLFQWRSGCFSQDGSRNELSGAVAYGASWINGSSEDVITELRQRGCEALLILTPTPQHFEQVLVALLAGMPVICEKALGGTAEQTAYLALAQRQNGVPLYVIYNYSGYPMVRELRRIVAERLLGRLLHVEAEMPQEGYLREGSTPQQWRLQDGVIPTVYLDLGVHLHQLVNYVTGQRPVRVMADDAMLAQRGVVDYVNALAHYEDGMRARFSFGKAVLGQRNGLRIRLCGDKGSAEWVQSNPEELHVAFADGTRTTLDRGSSLCKVANLPRYQRFKAGHPAGYVEALANLYADIHQELNGVKTGEVFGASLAHEGMLLMHAMVNSTRSGKWEPV